MFTVRRITVPRLPSRINTNLHNHPRRSYSSSTDRTSTPAPATESQEVAQQTQNNTVAPRPLKEPPPDDGLYWTALGLVLVTPPIMWYYYQHRKEHMGRKKEEMLQKLAEKRAAFQREMGK